MLTDDLRRLIVIMSKVISNESKRVTIQALLRKNSDPCLGQTSYSVIYPGYDKEAKPIPIQQRVSISATRGSARGGGGGGGAGKDTICQLFHRLTQAKRLYF